MKRDNEAIKVYQSVITDNADAKWTAYAYAGIGQIYTSTGQYASAVEPFRRSDQLEPHAPDTIIALGVALYFTKQYVEAASTLENGLKLRPKDTNVYIMLVRTYVQLGRQDDARRAYGALRQIDSTAADQLKGVIK